MAIDKYQSQGLAFYPCNRILLEQEQKAGYKRPKIEKNSKSIDEKENELEGMVGKKSSPKPSRHGNIG